MSKKYNNADTVLAGDLQASGDTFVVKSWEGALFPPTAEAPYKMTHEHRDGEYVIKREVLTVDSRTGDSFHISARASEYCVQDDSASTKTRTNNALSFVSGDRVFLGTTEEDWNELETEVFTNIPADIEQAKTDLKKDIQKGQTIYGASTTGNDDYAITLDPVPESLVSLKGQIQFLSDVENTGPATLNINGLGAKAIKKKNDKDLEDWDIEALQIVAVIFNSGDDVFEMVSQVATVVDLTSAGTNKMIIGNLKPGETLTDGLYAFRKGTGSEDTDKIYKDVSGDILGIYKGVTDGFTDTVNNYSGANLEIYGSNVYGLVSTHIKSIINGIELSGTAYGSGTFDFGIYPFDGSSNVDTDNPIYTETGVSFWGADYTVDQAEVSYKGSSWTTMRGFTATDSGTIESVNFDVKGDYNSSSHYTYWALYINGVSQTSSSKNYSNSYASHSFTWSWSFESGDLIEMKLRQGASNYAYPSYMRNIVFTVSRPFAGFDFADTNITAGTDYAFVFVNSSGDTSNKIVLVGSTSTDTNLIQSTTGIWGVAGASTWGIYNKIKGGSTISLITLINAGVYTHDEDILDNTDYYITGAGVLTTTASGNLLIGTSFSTRDILLSL